jgi:hypothetical protein
MINLPERVRGKTALKAQFVNLTINYFFVAISKIKMQCCLYKVKLHLLFGSANLGNKAEDILV